MKGRHLGTLALFAVLAVTLAMAVAPVATAANSPNAPTGPQSRSEMITGSNPVGQVKAITGSGGSCVAVQTIKNNYTTETESATANTEDCVGAAACSKFVRVQIDSPTDPGVWVNLTTSSIKDGCAPSNEAIAVTGRCNHSGGYWYDYRAQAYFAIVWDDGDLTEAGPYYSPSTAAPWLC